MSQLLIVWVLIFSPVDESRIVIEAKADKPEGCAQLQNWVMENPEYVLLQPCRIHVTEVVSI